MTKNIQNPTKSQWERLLAEQHRIAVQKEVLTALCLSLVSLLGAVLIFF